MMKNVYFFLLFSMMASLTVAVSSCSKDDDGESGNRSDENYPEVKRETP